MKANRGRMLGAVVMSVGALATATTASGGVALSGSRQWATDRTSRA